MGSHYLNGFVMLWDTQRRMLPEAELWTEVILQAIDDLDRCTSSASRSARHWFASEDDGIGSFVWSCRVVDVDPSRVRSALAGRAVLEASKKKAS
jgi:hypothetical protein